MARAPFFVIALSALSITAATAGAATVLTFEPASLLPDDTLLNNAYGDNVSDSPQDGFIYAGATDTADVTVDYSSLKAYTANPGNTYGDLVRIAYTDTSSASITFTAAPGFLVTLNSLDLAGYNSDQVLSSLSVTGGTSAFVQTNVPAPDTGHNTVDLGITGSTLMLNITDTSGGSVGLSNISFSQSAVPEPAVVGFMGMGAAGLLARRRRI